MSKFSTTNRSNACPVCGDISGKCRTKNDGGQEFVLCMTNGDAKLFDIIDGWKCVKTGSKGWATFTLDNTQPRLSDEERQQRRAQREAEEKAIYQGGLSIAERHSAYSHITSQLRLHSTDKADLQRRGLSPATIATFASIEPWQQLSQSVSDHTPGSNGRKLLSPYSGYLVPARNIEGQTVGFQIRNRATGEGAPKYPWLSTQSRPANLQDGELPITYANGNGTAVYLCEGLLKPLVAAERHGVRFIGAAGGNFASSPIQLKEYLEKLQPTSIVLCPDGGAVANRQVMHQYSRLAELVSSLGHSLSVQWWGQSTKTDGDIDEITREQFEVAQLLTWAEFKGKATASQREEQAAPTQSQQEKQSKAEWKRQQRIERDRRAYAQIAKLLGIKADIDADDKNYKKQARALFYEPLKQLLKYETHGTLSSGFVSEIKPATDGRSLIAYDCSQGTGKSNNALIPAALRTARGIGRVLIIVPTRGLAREFKGRINDQAGFDIAATHLDSKFYSAAIVVTCPESTYKFKGQNFELIQIDEANEVLHRIESAELGNAGPQSLKTFRALLASVPTVAIATAAMSGWTLAAVQTIGGFTPAETHLQRLSRPTTAMQVVEYGDYYQWLQQIIDALRAGQRVAIPTGAQKRGREIDRVLRTIFKQKNGLVIDGAATLQNQRARFLENPDLFLAGEKPDWFIFTPVINSGVSIEGEHFDVQFEYATPHEGAQSVSQRGERVRSAIGRNEMIAQRHVYFSQKGAPTLEAYPDALSWQYWNDELANEAHAPMGAAAALAKALGAEKALNPLKQNIASFAAMRPNLTHFLALKAFEVIYKKELLHEDWQRFGWEIIEASEPTEEQQEQIDSLIDLTEKIKIKLIEQTGSTFKKTRTRESDGELDEINNPFQAARAAKHQLEQLLGKDYLAKQDEKFFTAWVADKSASNPGIRSIVRSQLLKLAVTDGECWQQIERMKALKFLAGKPDINDGDFWHLPELPAAACDIELVSIMSRCPGVIDVIQGKLKQWTNKDPQVLAAGLYLVVHSKQIAANTKKTGLIRGAKFSDQMAPAALFNKALEMMGYAPYKAMRQGSGERLNVYRIKAAEDILEEVKTLKDKELNPLKLFRAELKAVRAQSRVSVNAAAKKQIIAKALAWVSEKAERQVEKGIRAIKKRHADPISFGLSKLGDASYLDVAGLANIAKQMPLIDTKGSHPPPSLPS